MTEIRESDLEIARKSAASILKGIRNSIGAKYQIEILDDGIRQFAQLIADHLAPEREELERLRAEVKRLPREHRQALGTSVGP